MDQDAEARILTAITSLTKTVEEYHGDFKEFRGETKIRVQAIEEDMKNDRMWSTIKTVVVVPVIAIIHQVGAHFGLIK
jgi:hypothetical protein